MLRPSGRHERAVKAARRDRVQRLGEGESVACGDIGASTAVFQKARTIISALRVRHPGNQTHRSRRAARLAALEVAGDVLRKLPFGTGEVRIDRQV
jgi:hypothetical protein